MTKKEKQLIWDALNNLRKATHQKNIKPKKIDKLVWTARILLELVLDT